jgi:prophage antirepressor-like protein
MNEIMGFNYGDKEVRTIVKDGEPWFVAKDVCEILGLAKVDTALTRLPVIMKDTHSMGTLGGNQDMSVISEPGVYKLVFTSRKPEAEKFTNWVTSEVIPAIRKHGMYATDEMLDKLVESPDLVISIATKLKEEKAARIAAEDSKKQLEIKVEEDAPKVEFYDDVVDSTNLFNLTTTAKMLGLGVVKMCKVLRDAGVLFYQNNINVPYQDQIDEKRFVVKMKQNMFRGPIEPIPQTFATAKGIAYIKKKMNDVGITVVEGGIA